MILIGFGDSITAGAYLQVEQTWLYKAGQQLDLQTINAGVPGNTSSQGLARLQQDVLARKPDICVIAFGMNDHVALSRSQSKVSLKDFEHNLNVICNEVKQIGGTPVLCTIHPIIEGDEQGYYYSRHPREWYADPDGAQAWIDQYNEVIRQVAATQDVALADVAHWWQSAVSKGVQLTELLRTVENSDISDGVHPTEQGMDVYADCIANVIAEKVLSFT